MIEIIELDLAKIDFSEEKIRPIDGATINDLRESIKRYGVLQPILVRSNGYGRYEVIFGHHRVIAAKGAGHKTIPAQVRQMSKKDALLLSISENIQRLELDPIKEGEVYSKLLREYYGPTFADLKSLSFDLGKTYVYIKGRIDIFEKLAPELQPELGKKLTIDCAKRLVKLSMKNQKIVFDEIERNRGVLENHYAPKPHVFGGCGFNVSDSDKCTCPRCGSKHYKGSNTIDNEN